MPSGAVALEPEVTAWLDGPADDEFDRVRRRRSPA